MIITLAGNKRALIASVEQIRAENRAREDGKQGCGKQPAGEIESLRKELTDMKSQMNQLRMENRRLKQGGEGMGFKGRETNQGGSGRFQPGSSG